MTLSGATTVGQRRPWSDDNEWVHYIPPNSSITGASPSDCLVVYIGHTLEVGLTSLPRCSRCILQPQPTELLKYSKNAYALL